MQRTAITFFYFTLHFNLLRIKVKILKIKISGWGQEITQMGVSVVFMK